MCRRTETPASAGRLRGFAATAAIDMHMYDRAPWLAPSLVRREPFGSRLGQWCEDSCQLHVNFVNIIGGA